MLQLPTEFIERIESQLGVEVNDFLESLDTPAPVSVRINPEKSISKFDSYEKVLWTDNSFYLPERISFTLDPLFHAGCYYVQEASSMFLEQALRLAFADGESKKVLDLCAAPGGKSTHIVSLLPTNSFLVSNEIIPSRNKILQQNITKWGNANVIVTQNDPADFSRIPGFFDVIVVDAPCSGEGLFRKDNSAVNEWSEQAVSNCAFRQTDILDKIIPSLNDNGILIYSTCTYEPAENDMQCQRLIESYGMELVNLECDFEGVEKTKYGYQFYPHKVKGEGFYLAVLKKTSSDEGKPGKVKEDFSAHDQNYFSEWLEDSDAFLAYKKEDALFAIPEFMRSDFPILMKNLYVRKAGVHLGKTIKKELIPSHELALCNNLNKVIPRVALNEEQAIRYLKCETLSLPGLVKGWYVCEFNGFALGWIKAIGNRINNYFPKELRILMR